MPAAWRVASDTTDHLTTTPVSGRSSPAIYSATDWIIVVPIKIYVCLPTMSRHRYRVLRPGPSNRQNAVAVVCLGLVLAFNPVASLAAGCRPVPAEKPAAARGDDFKRGLLWKIETAGVAPSYLFGTFHTSDPRITTLPCPVDEVFGQTASYTMEVIVNGPGISSMAEAMYFSDGKKLKDVLGDVLYQETLRSIRTNDSSSQIAIDHMKPWAVLMMLSGPRSGSGLFLDMALQLRAIYRDKPTYGLETMQEQIAVFNGMTLDDQIVLLRDAVRDTQRPQDAMEEITQAYLKRDLGALLNLNEKYKPEDARIYASMMDRLLVQRNINMATRMRVRLQEGNAFIAVGALHLPGDTGLLRLLRDAGYRVTRIY